MIALVTSAVGTADSQRTYRVMDWLIGQGIVSDTPRRSRWPGQSDDLRLGRVVRYEDRRI